MSDPGILNGVTFSSTPIIQNPSGISSTKVEFDDFVLQLENLLSMTYAYKRSNYSYDRVYGLHLLSDLDNTYRINIFSHREININYYQDINVFNSKIQVEIFTMDRRLQSSTEQTMEDVFKVYSEIVDFITDYGARA